MDFKADYYRAFLSSSGATTSSEWISLLNKENSRIDMMGYSHNMLTRATLIQDLLKELVNKNVKISILIMDSENPHFTAGLNFEGISSMMFESMRDEVVTCIQCIEGVLDKINKN